MAEITTRESAGSEANKALFDSVAPEVNTMRSASAPISVPKRSRADSSCWLASPASRYRLEGLCQCFSLARSQASRAAWCSVVVALWSK